MPLAEATPDRLARLLEWESQALQWRPDDLKAFLEHQMRVPFLFSDTGASDAGTDSSSGMDAAGGVSTLGELFRHPSPGVQRLDLVRSFAKANLTDDAATLPPDVARVIYYAAITLARLRHGISISRLTDPELLDGLHWARNQPWLGDTCSAVVEDGISMLTE